MTIEESLQAENTYPIDSLYIQKICLDRDLVFDADYTKVIGQSKEYRLALADTYFYLSKHPSITEQKTSINNTEGIKQDYLDKANEIYNEYDDPKFTGDRYGFIGEDYNG